MLVLDSAGKSIVIEMSDAVSSQDPVAFAFYADSFHARFIEGGLDLDLDGPGEIELVPAPLDGAKRLVRTIIVTNADDIAHSFVISLKTDLAVQGGDDEISDPPVYRAIWLIDLDPNESWFGG